MRSFVAWCVVLGACGSSTTSTGPDARAGGSADAGKMVAAARPGSPDARKGPDATPGSIPDPGTTDGVDNNFGRRAQ